MPLTTEEKEDKLQLPTGISIIKFEKKDGMHTGDYYDVYHLDNGGSLVYTHCDSDCDVYADNYVEYCIDGCYMTITTNDSEWVNGLGLSIEDVINERCTYPQYWEKDDSIGCWIKLLQ